MAYYKDFNDKKNHKKTIDGRKLAIVSERPKSDFT